MSNLIKHLERASRFRQQMENELDAVNSILSKHLGDSGVAVFYQAGDGWIVLFDDDHNALMSFDEMGLLLDMKRDEALAYLHEKSA